MVGTASLAPIWSPLLRVCLGVSPCDGSVESAGPHCCHGVWPWAGGQSGAWGQVSLAGCWGVILSWGVAACGMGQGAVLLQGVQGARGAQRGNGQCLPDCAASPNHAYLKKGHWGPQLPILCLLGDQWGTFF